MTGRKKDINKEGRKRQEWRNKGEGKRGNVRGSRGRNEGREKET